MYELKILTQFAAAHQLSGIGGGCENLHGHNWKIEVYVCGDNLNNEGLLIDFRDMKEKTEILMEELDHKFLNELAPFVKVSPSSENISRYILEYLSRELNTENVRISKVTVWESDSACASYTET